MAVGSHIGVFVDRDGTLTIDPGYLADPAGLALYPEARDAVALLKQAGVKLLLATNQSGIARGLLSEETLALIHAELERLLDSAFDAIYYCPHHPSEGKPPYRAVCSCRKPEPGMLERGMRDWGLKAEDCYMLGDSDIDVMAGRKAGVRTVQFLNGTSRIHSETPPDHVATSLLDAARWILRDAERHPSPAAIPPESITQS